MKLRKKVNILYLTRGAGRTGAGAAASPGVDGPATAGEPVAAGRDVQGGGDEVTGLGRSMTSSISKARAALRTVTCSR
jgi:hypothetical protein